MTAPIGIDFGTTNSVVAMLQPDGSVTTQTYAFGHARLDTFRTVLCFWNEEARGRSVLHHAAGPAAVQAYLDDPLDSRLIMSMKTYLAQRSFVQTSIFGRMHGLEQMVALFLKGLLNDGHAGAQVVAGRPVRFAGEFADDGFGEMRLRASFARAGFEGIGVALEPEAAGFRFARGLDAAATVLVGDFGGGTSDFSVMRFAPGRVAALGHAGIGIAGDSFDARIIDQVIAPLLGKGDVYSIMGNALPVPPEYFSGFARWHRLSLMRTPRMLREIEEVAAASEHPGRLRALIRLIEDEMGYPLYQAVSAVKAELSHARSAVLRFTHGNFAVERLIERQEFERWIAPDLARLSLTVGQALDQAGVRADEIDRVFLTGGTSFVPAVRALFEQRFGASRVSGGGEFVSVAEGLALIGQDRLRSA
ncbi:Hsp70 family protein [Lichenicoccus sp.]|uniref:Hsp70 family protein n=1 Tax=Lichenicoccus sp. TaxID=2781899 RepID=UPI003D10D0A5